MHLPQNGTIGVDPRPTEAINDAHKNGVTALALSSDCGRIVGAPAEQKQWAREGPGAVSGLNGF